MTTTPVPAFSPLRCLHASAGRGGWLLLTIEALSAWGACTPQAYIGDPFTAFRATGAGMDAPALLPAGGMFAAPV